MRKKQHPTHQKSDAVSSTRRVPQHIKTKVWRRDGGRCQYVGSDGKRCGEEAWLEFDHIQPWALGGLSDDVQNVRLLCRTHNQLSARKIFGKVNQADA